MERGSDGNSNTYGSVPMGELYMLTRTAQANAAPLLDELMQCCQYTMVRNIIKNLNIACDLHSLMFRTMQLDLYLLEIRLSLVDVSEWDQPGFEKLWQDIKITIPGLLSDPSRASGFFARKDRLYYDPSFKRQARRETMLRLRMACDTYESAHQITLTYWTWASRPHIQIPPSATRLQLDGRSVLITFEEKCLQVVINRGTGSAHTDRSPFILR